MVPNAHSYPQEKKAILQAPTGGTGGRVHDERVHYQAAAEGVVRQAQPQRPAGQNLVPKQEDEEEKTLAAGAGAGFLLERVVMRIIVFL